MAFMMAGQAPAVAASGSSWRSVSVRRCALRGRAPSELALGRTADNAPQQLGLFHLRCAATATWAAEVPLQPLLRDYAAAAEGRGAQQNKAASLTERELAIIIYQELRGDERRAKRRA